MSLSLDDLEHSRDVQLRSTDGDVITVDGGCLKLSLFLSALVFDDDDSRMVEVDLSSNYLSYAGKYFEAQCRNDQEALLSLSDPSYLSSLPLLNRYIYGYLGIDSFASFYQEMIVKEIESGIYVPERIQELTANTLSSLSDHVLFRLTPFIHQRINEVYGVHDSINYLKVKLARDTMARVGDQLLVVREDGIYLGQNRVYYGDVVSIHGTANRYFYFLTANGSVYQGTLQGRQPIIASRINLPPLIKLAKTTIVASLVGITVNHQVLIYDPLRNGCIIPNDIEDAFDIIVPTSNPYRIYILYGPGRVANYGYFTTFHATVFHGYDLGVMGANTLPTIRYLPLPYPVRSIAPDEQTVLKGDLTVEMIGDHMYAQTQVYGVFSGGRMIDEHLDLLSIPNALHLASNAISVVDLSVLQDNGHVITL